SFSTTAATLGQLFEGVGEVSNATIVAFNGRSRGYGFVTMKDESTAINALKALDKRDLDGRSINVEVARAEGDRRPRDFGGPRRFGGGGRYDNGFNGGYNGGYEGGYRRYAGFGGGRRFGRFSRFGRRPRRGPAPDPNAPLSKTRIHLGNLPFRLTDEELKKEFEGYQIKEVVIAKSSATGRAFGFGFIEFVNEDEQRKAIAEKNNFDLLGRRIFVNPARERAAVPATAPAPTSG
ncbi:MAG: hypothetical protein EZS28_012710, partial [Streblomastix strix]